MFPLPSFLIFAATQLNLLHTGNKLYNRTLISCILCETTIIQLSPFFHEKQHPKDIQSRGGKEYGKDQQIVVKQYSSENQDIDSGKENRK
ncbi:hypothetical protein SDC9_97630 [bioreactor metagenome]|uniref:Uncharacterized protein n=1 Tax=bioreactor metagenome TaxID=1076179 RepID=A0A645AMN0_9ZZZZ